MKKIHPYILLFILITTVSCERDATIDIKGGEQKPVVYGWIEPGMPPVVILTQSKPYFGTTNFSELSDLFIHNANVTVATDNYTAPLSEICSQNVSPSLLPVIAEYLGVDSATLSQVNYCVYTTFDSNIFGQTGKKYFLNISFDSYNLSSETEIPQPVALDSVWFKVQPPATNLGFIWATLSDPPASGNCYRWFAKREGKDFSFIAPMGSAFEDKFINGTTFNFAFNRGDDDFATTPEPPEERGYFKIGDTVIVKFCSIDAAHYQFWRTFEIQVSNNGNPFAAPAPVKSNINGGLGIWGGYGPAYDTVVCQ
jgi:hypothetical protein